MVNPRPAEAPAWASRFDSCSAATPCPLCGALEGCVLSRKARDGAPLTTLLCMGCGLGRTDPIPTEEALAAYYRDEYRSDYKGVRIPRKKHVLRAARLARQRLDFLEPWVAPQAAVLDLGAGGGEFVYFAREAGLLAEGIEPNAGYARYARETLGLPVTSGTWQTHAASPGSLGAITMFHVLEHLPDPLACLRELHRWLAPGGVLLVEVPNLLTPVGHPANRFHRAHLMHFDPDTLCGAFLLAGFEVLRTWTSPDQANVLVCGRKTMEGAAGPAEERVLSTRNAQAALEWECSRPRFPYLHPKAWLRFANRMLGASRELLTVSRFPDGPAILKALAKRA